MPESPSPTSPATPAPVPTAGLLVVISGPSGVGKTTLTHMLRDELGAVFSVSFTTRTKSAKDVEGADYHFVDVPRFRRAIEEGELLEWAEVFGNYYGTPRAPVEANLAAGRDVLLEIDVHGAIQVKRCFPHALSVFVLPPSEEELLNRLRSRRREDESVIQRRFSEARREITQARESGAYDEFVVNHELGEALEQICHIVERRRRGG